MTRRIADPITETARRVLAARWPPPETAEAYADVVRDVLAELGLEYSPDPEDDDDETREDDDAPERDDDDAQALAALRADDIDDIDHMLRALSQGLDDDPDHDGEDDLDDGRQRPPRDLED